VRLSKKFGYDIHEIRIVVEPQLCDEKRSTFQSVSLLIYLSSS
jgi:hypothetical protein